MIIITIKKVKVNTQRFYFFYLRNVLSGQKYKKVIEKQLRFSMPQKKEEKQLKPAKDLYLGCRRN